MLIYGFHPVREALRQGPEGGVVRVMIGRERRGGRVDEILDLCSRLGIQVERAPDARLDELTEGVHNGFAAETHGRSRAVARADEDLVVLVEDVQDPRNLGALLRVCEGAGVGRVLIRDRGSSAITPTVAKTAAGATEWLAIERVTNSAAAIREHQKSGFWAYGAEMSGRPPWEVDLSGRLLLCFGGEQKGLRRLTRETCDGLIGLPMRGRVGSLNLASAAAAILYEALRQRR